MALKWLSQLSLVNLWRHAQTKLQFSWGPDDKSKENWGKAACHFFILATLLK